VPFAVAMDPHHANPAFSVSVLDQRHAQNPPVFGKSRGLVPPGLNR